MRIIAELSEVLGRGALVQHDTHRRFGDVLLLALAQARRHVAATFTLSHMQRATLSVYDELLSSRLAARFDERSPPSRAPSST